MEPVLSLLLLLPTTRRTGQTAAYSVEEKVWKGKPGFKFGLTLAE